MSKILMMAREGQSFKDELLIDSHTHIGFNNHIYTPYSDMESIVSNMERVGLDMACICAYPYGSIGDPFFADDILAGYVNKHPDKFMGYVTINPNYRKCMFDEMVRGVKIGLKLGMKMHTFRQPHNINDEEFTLLFEYMNERNAVFLHHDFGKLSGLEKLLGIYKNITFITGHFTLDSDYLKLARKYDNLYINTCASLGMGRIKELVDKISSEKVVYGSDLIVFDPTFGYGVVAFAKICDEDKRNILGRNMKRIIGKIKI
jgi:uncharacterized protein